jgi:hypothetical protein
MRFLFALCLLIVLSGPARALDGLVECPDGNEALPRVTHTPDGYPLTETFAIETGGRKFAVPIGYLRFWPTPKSYRIQPIRNPRRFRFSLWMPDGRMPESDPRSSTFMNRPCDAGRPQADAEHYIVNVTYQVLPAGPPYPGALFDYDRVRSVLMEMFNFESEVQTRHGDMVQYDPSPLSGYWILSAPGAPFGASVRCRKTTKPPNDACSGDIRFHGDDYALNIRIPRDSVEDFEAAAKLARRLIGEWRQGAVAE